LKVLILTPAFPPEITGSGHLMSELAESLTKRGHEVTVITAIPRQRMGVKGNSNVYKNKLLAKEKIGDIHILRPRILTLPLSNPIAKGIDHFLLAMSYYWAGRRISRQDMVMVYSPPLILGLTGISLAKKFRSPLVFNAQDMFPRYAVDTGVLNNKLLIRFFTRIEEYVYGKATCITVHSDGNHDYLVSRGVDGKKIDIIPNWVDTRRFQPGLKSNELRAELGLEKAFLVSYSGTIGWAQGLDAILESARLLRNRPEISFLIVGDGPRRKECESIVLRDKLNNIQLLQLLPREKYARLLQASDVCLISLHPKISTPVVPGKLFDIMATGRPVVANIPSSSDACDIINVSRCGICVPPDRPRELSEAILYLSDNPAEANRMGRNGRQYVEKHFSREICTGQYERLFARLADNP
jgi:glycosyltransferase involved in cell wall biosynthesis